MWRFPNEENRVAEVREKFRTELDFADALGRAWLEVESEAGFQDSSPAVRDLGIRLIYQEFRIFRSVVEECRRSEAYCGDIVCRSLLEATVVMGFFVKTDIAIKLKPRIKDGVHLKTDEGVFRYTAVRDTSGATDNILSPEMKTKLYDAHTAFARLAFRQRLKAVPGIQWDSSDDAKLDEATNEANRHKKIIGEEWGYVLQEEESYSGLNIAETTNLVCPHLLQVYKTAWKAQCLFAHAAGAFHIDGWFSHDSEIQGTLRVACMLLLRCIDLLQKHLRIAETHCLDLEGWLKRFYGAFNPTE